VAPSSRQPGPPEHKEPGKPGTWLFVVPWDLQHAGGVNQVVINLYRECERAKALRPLVLVLDLDRANATTDESAGCKIIRLRVTAPAGDRVGYRMTVRELLRYLVELPAALYRLRKVLADNHVTVVNAHYPTLSLVSFALLRSLGSFKGKLLLSFHGQDVRNAAQQRGPVTALWHWVLRNADSLVSCSNSLATEVAAFYAPTGGISKAVHNGIDADALMSEMALSSAMNIPLPKRRYILNVATFEHKKGQDVLVRAFARMADDFPDIDLIMIGRDGPARARIEAIADDLLFQGRISILVDRPHPEVLAYLSKALLFALPSRSEGLPIVILEAAVLGIPVVASRVDGIPEVIDSVDLGVLVAAEDDRALELALRKLLADEALRADLGRRLREHVIREFSWRKAWQRYVGLLDTAGSARIS